jgi:hypothetical protein
MSATLPVVRKYIQILLTVCLFFPVYPRADTAVHKPSDIRYPIAITPDSSPDALAVEKLLTFHLPRLIEFFDCPVPESLSIEIVTASAAWTTYRDRGAPEWAAGLYLPAEQRVVLNLTGKGNLRNLENVLVHELAHVFYARAFQAAAGPAWFNEGLAEYLSGGIFEMNTLLLANVQAAGNLPGLEDLAYLHTFPRARAELGYTQSLSAVQYLFGQLRESGGWEAFRVTLRRSGWQTALEHHLHTDDIGFEIDWYRYVKNQYRWQVIFNIENLLWAACGGMIVLAFFWKTWRNRRKMRQWERQESEMQRDEPPAPTA